MGLGQRRQLLRADALLPDLAQDLVSFFDVAGHSVLPHLAGVFDALADHCIGLVGEEDGMLLRGGQNVGGGAGLGQRLDGLEEGGLFHLALHLLQRSAGLGVGFGPLQEGAQGLFGVLSNHFFEGGLGIVGVEHGGQGLARDGYGLGQVVWAGMEEGLGQLVRQSLGDLLVLLRGGGLGRGKEHAPALRVVDEEWGVYAANVAAVGAGGGVDVARADAVGQVGPLGQVYEEPDFEVNGLATFGARGMGGLGV